MTRGASVTSSPRGPRVVDPDQPVTEPELLEADRLTAEAWKVLGEACARGRLHMSIPASASDDDEVLSRALRLVPGLVHQARKTLAERERADLSFTQLRAANTARLPLFRNRRGEIAHAEADGSDWSPADWMTAVVGELGEAANVLKKIRRGDFGDRDALADAAQQMRYELADVVIYLDILAKQLGIDLGEAVREKFNIVSDRVGADVKL